jgi:hypothetical protein
MKKVLQVVFQSLSEQKFFPDFHLIVLEDSQISSLGFAPGKELVEQILLFRFFPGFWKFSLLQNSEFWTVLRILSCFWKPANQVGKLPENFC